MNCHKCNSPLKPGAKFCVYCGTPVASAPVPEASQPDPAPQPAPEPMPSPEAPAVMDNGIPAEHQAYVPEGEPAVPQQMEQPMDPQMQQPYGNMPMQSQQMPPQMQQPYSNMPPQSQQMPPQMQQPYGNMPPQGQQMPPQMQPPYGNMPPQGQQMPPQMQPPYGNMPPQMQQAPGAPIPPGYVQGSQPTPAKKSNIPLICGIALISFIVVGVACYFLFSAKHDAEPSKAYDESEYFEDDNEPEFTATPAPGDPSVPYDYTAEVCYHELTPSDLTGRPAQELRLMRNTIYARHGYIFKSEDLKEYFSKFDWYHPNTSVVPESEMSQTELKNVMLIKSFE